VHSWSTGDQLTHRFNTELGTGRVTGIEGRVLVVHFPDSDTTLRLAATSDALVPVTGPTARRDRPLLARLADGDVDPPDAFLSRLDVLRLLAAREAGGLGSMLGGRVRLFPHQLHVAERATARLPVRWLLADEVGLGKTIEAALIMNRLLHTQRIERCLVVAPDVLTVQWLGELWRKYHQVFTLLDAPRLADVARDFGEGFNPFDVHRRAVIALETLTSRPDLTAKAVDAGIDLLVVDEAQRLRWPPGRGPGAAYRSIAPIAALGRHVLLLSATPLEDDAHGFFRLLQLLRPEEFPGNLDVEARLASGSPLPPCTSATRRVDIGGLPPRVPRPVDVDVPGTIAALAAARPARQAHPLGAAPPGDGTTSSGETTSAAAGDDRRRHLVARRAADRVRRALASGAALAAVLGPDEDDLRRMAADMDRADPRLAWLVAHAARWRSARQKTLVFVAHRETLELLRTTLSARASLATAVFHEDLSAARRDLEVARFRAEDGPSLLVTTEAGGEGRNFEFCDRLVLYDLPWRPTTVEQRIGRLDRIGRQRPVEIVYFRPSTGIGADVVRLYERIGLFTAPIAGIEPQLAHVERALEALALDPSASLTDEAMDALLSEADAARARVHDAVYRQLHHEPYRPELAPSILARVPPDLDATMERVITTAAVRLGLRVEPVRGSRAYAIELGHEAFVDSLPGVAPGATFVGSFDRAYAVEDETRDFFASGHPLVEGLLAHVEDAPEGRVAHLELRLPGGSGAGVLALHRDGHRTDVRAFDVEGVERRDWAEAVLTSTAALSPMSPEDVRRHDWPAIVRRLAPRLAGRPVDAVATLVVADARSSGRPPRRRRDATPTVR